MRKRHILVLDLVLVITTSQAYAATASGPLRIHPTNPRYFTDGSGKAVLLTGSHTWANLQDIGLTSIGYGVDDLDRLLKSPADWISPNPDHFDYKNDPPPADGAKVIVLDTDHLWGVGGTVPWVWKSFLRGLNPIWMDPWDKASVWEPTPGNAEAVRNNLGYALRFAERMNLVAMKPQAELASTRYCLANAGVEYLVYQPEPGQSFSVEPKPGTYRCEWFSPTKGAWANANRLEAAGGRQQFKAPFAGDAVLYLKVQ